MLRHLLFDDVEKSYYYLVSEFSIQKSALHAIKSQIPHIIIHPTLRNDGFTLRNDDSTLRNDGSALRYE